MTKEQRNKYMRDRYASRPDAREYQINRTLARYHSGHWKDVQSQNLAIKEEVLTHYSPNGVLGCCWLDCGVCDIDMLSLDHIADDGAKHRSVLGAGTRIYRWALAQGFPEGLQTLCHNH